MPALSIYEPPGCCSTGVCGPGVEQSMVQFTSAIDWIGKQGVDVARYNLSHQPAAFAENTAVRDAIASDGMECLPLVMVDGDIVSKGVYLSRDELAKMVGVAAGDDQPGADEPADRASGCC